VVPRRDQLLPADLRWAGIRQRLQPGKPTSHSSSAEAQTNDHAQNTLTYNCVCSSGNKPNISDYDQTLPSLVCGQWVGDCVNAHPNDLDGQTTCLSVVCGSKNASTGVSTSSSAMSSASATASSSGGSGGAGGAQQTATSSSDSGSSSSTASSSGSASSASSSSAAIALNLASNYGTGILAAGILGAFGLAL